MVAMVRVAKRCQFGGFHSVILTYMYVTYSCVAIATWNAVVVP